MSTVRANNYYDASGGSNAQLYGVASPPNSMGFRNRIINGDMRIDQRNAGASVSIVDGNNVYPVDRWFGTGTASSGVFSLQRSSSTPPTGFSNFLRATVTTVDSSLAATDFYGISQRIEGFNTADLALGTASASAMTLSFKVRSSLTGTFTGAVTGNPASSASFPFTFTINSANTWEDKTVSVAAPTSGTFPTDNSIGLAVWFMLGVGSTYTGTAGAWTAAARFGASGAVNVMATNGATLDITGVQLEAGTVASPFERRDYGRELIMCQRYFEKSFDANTAPAHNTGPFLIVPNGGSAGCGGNTYTTMFYKVSKRSSSTIRIYDPFGAAAATTNAFRSYTACNSGTQSTGFFPDGQTTEFFAGTYQAATAGSIGFLWTADSEL